MANSRLSDQLIILGASLLLFELLFSLHAQLYIPLNGDVTIHLNAAQRILHGTQLYRDIVTVNLPMQFYFRVPGAWISEYFDLDPIGVVIAFDTLTALLSFGLLMYLFYRMRLTSVHMLFVIAGMLLYILLIFPVYDVVIGEKEYFFWLMTIPYFTLTAARANGVVFGRGFRLFIGAFAAIGFCYKPCCIFPLILVEGSLCAQARSLKSLYKAEFILCILLGALYLAWFLISMPEYIQSMLPIAKFYYFGRPETPILIGFYAERLLPFVLPTSTLWLYMLTVRPSSHVLLNIYLLALIGYMLDGIVQLKSFAHHLYPTFAMSMLIFAVSLAILRHQPQRFPIQLPFAKSVKKLDLVSVIVALFLVGLSVEAYFVGPYSPTTPTGEDALSQGMQDYYSATHQSAASVYKLGYRISPIFPEGIYQGMRWDYHFYHLWLLGGIIDYKTRHPEKSQDWLNAYTKDAEQFLRDTVTEDIEREKPDVLLVDRVNSINFMNYFTQEKRFNDLMRDYEFQEDIHGTDIYIRRPHAFVPQEQW